MALPIFNTSDVPMSLMQSSWAAQLNPVLANPLTNASVLKSISLQIGVNVINHKLGQTLQGWIISDKTGNASIYRSSPKNNLTLTLTSDAVVTVDIVVY